MKNAAAGIFFAAVSAFCWATLFPAAEALFRRGIVDVYTAVQCRFLAGGVILLAWLFILERRPPWRKLAARDFAPIFFQSVFASGMSVLLFCGQNRGLPVVNASMLEAEAPILIYLLGCLVLKTPISKLQAAGVLLGFAGSLLVLRVVTQEGVALRSFSVGDALVFAGAVCWALYTVLGNRTIKKIGTMRYTAWSLLFAGIWIWAFQLVAGMPRCYPASMPDAALVLYLGAVPTALAFFAWNHAQHFISPGLLGISGYFTPMLTAWLGKIFFSETITLWQFSGMLLVVGSALIEPEISGLLRDSRQRLFPKSAR